MRYTLHIPGYPGCRAACRNLAPLADSADVLDLRKGRLHRPRNRITGTQQIKQHEGNGRRLPTRMRTMILMGGWLACAVAPQCAKPWCGGLVKIIIIIV